MTKTDRRKARVEARVEIKSKSHRGSRETQRNKRVLSTKNRMNFPHQIRGLARM